MKTFLQIEPRSLTLKATSKTGHKQFLDENGERIIFQTDPCKIVAIKKDSKGGTKKVDSDKKKKLILALDCGLDMTSWFQTVQERLEGKFSNFRPFMEKDLLVKTDDSTMGFSRNKDFLPLSNLEINDTVIVILTTTGVWSDEVSSNLVWKVKQIVKL